MKKTTISLMAVLALAVAATSCSSDIMEGLSASEEAQDNKASNGKQPMTFTATQESSDSQTRTYIDGTDGTNSVKWQNGDAIAVYDETTTNEFSVSDGGGTTSATLTGEVTSESTNYSAVYPLSAVELSEDGTTISDIVIPDIQTATEGTYDPDAAVMTATATSTDKNFAFKNACSFLKITTSAAYQKIEVSVTSGTLSGAFTCSNYATATVEELSGYGKKLVALKPASGSTAIASGHSYFIAVAPGTISGLSVKCYTSASEYYERTMSSSFTLARSKYYSLGTTSGSSWTKKEGGYSVSSTKKVMFTTGNLYWDGDNSEYHLESTQTGSSRDDAGDISINYSHLSYFYWANTTDYNTSGMEPYATTYKYSSQSTTDKFWCGIDNPLTVDGTTNLYVLTNDEWIYLIQDRANADKLYMNNVDVTDGSNTYKNCLIIAPDNFDYSNHPLQSSYSLTEISDLGLTCLPCVGSTYDSPTGRAFYPGQSEWGCYWSSTPYEEDPTQGNYNAYNICWTYGYISTEDGFNKEMRKFGQCIRLVYTYTGE